MGLEKEMTKIPNFCNKWLFGMDAGRCADKPWQFLLHMHSGFPTKMVQQTFVMSLK